jgi:hypothetical protein
LNLFSVYPTPIKQLGCFCIDASTHGERATVPTVKTMVDPICLPVELDAAAHPSVRFMPLMAATNRVEAVPTAGCRFLFTGDYCQDIKHL